MGSDILHKQVHEEYVCPFWRADRVGYATLGPVA